MTRVVSLFVALLVGTGLASAQTVRNTVVESSCTVSESPPEIRFTWPANPTDAGYTIFRRLPGDTTWVVHDTAPTGAVAWTDTAVVVGQIYEYRFEKAGTPFGRGDATAAIHAPPVHGRRKLILLVADNHAAALWSELGRLELDLIGDGWQVIRHDVSPAASVPDVKALVLGEYLADPENVRALFLFGDLPVPYSGVAAYDGHSNHQGAWACDGFYGDMDGTWTDVSVNNTASSRTENHNVPGDGKYDQTIISSGVELMVGRVDLANMPAFAAGEEELLRAYLDKNHAYRQKMITVQERAVVDDNFGYFGGEAFAATVWRSCASMFGAANTVTGDYFTTLNTTSGPGYLWSYGCGGGTYTSAGGVGSTTDFTTSTNRTIFTMLFGSYHGDWDSQDNFMRASLCSGWTLSCAWAGRPAWTWSPMALGYTLGYAARWSQNDPSPRNSFGARGIHMGLMGDPSLRMHIMEPPADVTAAGNGGGVDVAWTASADAGLGYHVYRSPVEAGPYILLTASPVPGPAWIDPDPLPGANHYLVRAASLQTSGSGTYVNLSQGAMGSADVVVGVGDGLAALDDIGIRLSGRSPFRPPASFAFDVPVSGPVRVSIFDVLGREVRRVVDGELGAGEHTRAWDGQDDAGRRVAPGIYFLRASVRERAASIKLVLVR